MGLVYTSHIVVSDCPSMRSMPKAWLSKPPLYLTSDTLHQDVGLTGTKCRAFLAVASHIQIFIVFHGSIFIFKNYRENLETLYSRLHFIH